MARLRDSEAVVDNRKKEPTLATNNAFNMGEVRRVDVLVGGETGGPPVLQENREMN
jgi:hypothetical protein